MLGLDLTLVTIVQISHSTEGYENVGDFKDHLLSMFRIELTDLIGSEYDVHTFAARK